MAESGATRSLGHVYIEEARRRLATCHDRIIHCLNQLDDAQALVAFQGVDEQHCQSCSAPLRQS